MGDHNSCYVAVNSDAFYSRVLYFSTLPLFFFEVSFESRRAKENIFVWFCFVFAVTFVRIACFVLFALDFVYYLFLRFLRFTIQFLLLSRKRKQSVGVRGSKKRNLSSSVLRIFA